MIKYSVIFHKNFFNWLLVIVLMGQITGCWDYHELDKEAVISVFGYDLISPHHVKVSAYLETTPKANSSSNGNEGGMKKPEIIRAVKRLQIAHIASIHKRLAVFLLLRLLPKLQ